MNEYEANEIVKKQLCKEVIQIAEQIQHSGNMSDKDLERLDKLYHTKKSLLGAEAMEEAKEYQGGGESYASGNQNGSSERRGRSSITGRYVSREEGNSFAEGYSQGYSEAMSQMSQMSQAQGGNSGHYPMMPYQQRRW